MGRLLETTTLTTTTDLAAMSSAWSGVAMALNVALKHPSGRDHVGMKIIVRPFDATVEIDAYASDSVG